MVRLEKARAAELELEKIMAVGPWRSWASGLRVDRPVVAQEGGEAPGRAVDGPCPCQSSQTGGVSMP